MRMHGQALSTQEPRAAAQTPELPTPSPPQGCALGLLNRGASGAGSPSHYSDTAPVWERKWLGTWNLRGNRSPDFTWPRVRRNWKSEHYVHIHMFKHW